MNVKLIVLLVGALSFLLLLNVAAAVKIACAGDSVTYGYKIADRERFAYAWQPFPDANLVNAYGLPASTFILKIR